MTHLDLPKLALMAATAAFGLSVANAQSPAPSRAPEMPAPSNLQFFPKDIPRPELMANMRSFTQALGVKCSFCHVENSQPATGLNFASDANPEKRIARKMLAMVQGINQRDFGVPAHGAMKVSCFTCHRGATLPLTTPAVNPQAKSAAPPAGPAGTGRE
jgi:hypothetical protein